ncbi:MAG: MFS transporter [Phycisphaerae bacterium]|nr:MFS transporter [Phycisphaerae bacterium]MDD5381032.1 MFS transporter [Phycisphaerae bacterium]
MSNEQVQGGKTSTGHFRWIICALLFTAIALNYIDRQILGLLKPMLEKSLNWSEEDFGYIVIAFTIAYGISYTCGGWFMDRVGVKLGFVIAVVLWSLAEMAHALNWYIPIEARIGIFGISATVFGFCVARAVLGIAEGGSYPALNKTISEWFPKKERAFAFGIANSGTAIGAIAAPLLILWLATDFSWPIAFIVTGAMGLFWAVFWLPLYANPHKHKRISAAELAHIDADPPDPPGIKVPWRTLLKYRQTWMYIVGTGISGTVWWFWLYWGPDFLHKQYGLDVKSLGWPMVVVYLITGIGSITGGYLSGWFMKLGWSINASRKMAMLACALCVVPVFLASIIANAWVGAILMGLAMAAHQGFAANLFTMVSDTAPRRVVGSIVGLGGTAACIGTFFTGIYVPKILEATGKYQLVLIIASCAYVVTLLIIHLINPKLKPMEFDVSQAAKTK